MIRSLVIQVKTESLQMDSNDVQIEFIINEDSSMKSKLTECPINSFCSKLHKRQ